MSRTDDHSVSYDIECGYGRAGGLADWIDGADEQLDREHRETLARVQRLDHEVRGAILSWLSTEDSPVLHAIGQALILTNWDDARRAAGMRDMCVVERRTKRTTPLASLADALRVYQAARPVLGVSDLDLAKHAPPRGTRREPGVGYLRVHGSKTNAGRVANEDRSLLAVDVERAIETVLARHGGDPRAIRWLTLNVYGEWQRPTRDQALGAAPRKAQRTLVKLTIERIAMTDKVDVGFVRRQTSTLKRALTEELARRGLIPSATRRAA